MTNEQKDEWSVATDDDSSITAGHQKLLPIQLFKNRNS